MTDLLDNLRQLHYPPEFRIEPSLWPQDILQKLQDLVTAASAPRPSKSAVVETASTKLLAEIATNLWRLRQKILQPGTDQPLEEMRQVYRPFEAAWNTLLGAEIEILDHTGSPFNSGLLLHVLAFQPTPDIAQEIVIETIRPTVYYKRQIIQPGEVIVGMPESPPIDEGVEQSISSEQGDISS